VANERPVGPRPSPNERTIDGFYRPFETRPYSRRGSRRPNYTVGGSTNREFIV